MGKWTFTYIAGGEGGNNRLYLESRTPSWAGLWTCPSFSTFPGEAVLSEQNIPENQRQHDTVFIRLKICTILCLGVHANVIEQYFKGEAIITHRSRDEACLSQPRWERGQQCCQAVGREVLEKLMMGSQDFILLLCLINYTGIIYIFPSNVILK